MIEVEDEEEGDRREVRLERLASKIAKHLATELDAMLPPGMTRVQHAQQHQRIADEEDRERTRTTTVTKIKVTVVSGLIVAAVGGIFTFIYRVAEAIYTVAFGHPPSE